MSADLIEELRDGLEVATKGEWAVDGYNTAAVIFRQHGKTHVTDWMRLARCDEDNANWKADAAHIANCSPDNIRILLDALAAKDTALSEMRAELERVRQALEQIGVVCLDNASPPCRHDLALKFVADVAARAASQDEGEERK